MKRTLVEKVLLLSSVTLTASDKLFLLVFAARYGEGWSGELRIAELAEALGLKRGLVESSVPRLIAASFLVVQPVYKKRGRPLRKLSLNKTLIGAVPVGKEFQVESILSAISFLGRPTVRVASLRWASGSSATSAAKLIASGYLLQEGDNPIARKMVDGKSTFLDASGVLLLTLLLAASDPVGVVAGWSHRRLAAAIGVTRVALKGRLKKLTDNGVLRQVIPGIGASVFSRKLSSVYIVNINHPVFRGVCSPTAVLIFREDCDSERSKFLQVFWEQAVYARESGDLRHVAHIYRHLPKHAFLQIELFVNRLVSQWLTVRLAQERDIDRPSIRESIKGFLAILERGESVESKRAAFASESMIDELAYCAERLLEEVVLLFGTVIPATVKMNEVLMLPGNILRGYEYITLLVRAEVKSPSPVKRAPGAFGRSECMYEQEIPQNVRLAAGLAAE